MLARYVACSRPGKFNAANSVFTWHRRSRASTVTNEEGLCDTRIIPPRAFGVSGRTMWHPTNDGTRSSDGDSVPGDGGKGGWWHRNWVMVIIASIVALGVLLFEAGCDKLISKKKRPKRSSLDDPEPSKPKPLPQEAYLIGTGTTTERAMKAMRQRGIAIMMNSRIKVDCFKRKIHIKYRTTPICQRLTHQSYQCKGLWEEIYCQPAYNIGRFRRKTDEFRLGNPYLK